MFIFTFLLYLILLLIILYGLFKVTLDFISIVIERKKDRNKQSLEKLTNQLKSLYSKITLNPSLNYIVTGNLIATNGEINFQIDDYGVIRRLSFNETESFPTSYRLRNDKLYQISSQPHERGRGFINYYENEVGELTHYRTLEIATIDLYDPD